MKYLTRKTFRLVIRPLESKDYYVWKQANLIMESPQNSWNLGPKLPESLTKTKFKKVISVQAKKRKDDQFYHLGVFGKTGNSRY